MLDNQTPTPPSVIPVEPISPPAPQTSPVITVAPVTPPPQSKNSKLPFIIIGAVVLIILIAVGAFFLLKSSGGGSSIISGSGIKQAINPLSKYDKDADGDFIPDVIETKAGLDPFVSEITKCKSSGCDASEIKQAKNTQTNVLVILDASGSMAENIESQTKMDAAKAAISQYVRNASGKINIGLMVYGEKGSNSSSDKTLSCSSVDTLANIGSLTTQNVDSLLSTVKPTGWTAIGTALSKAQSVFAGKENQTNQIIVVSDGIETCDSNPVNAAAKLNSSSLKISVDVIGFGLDLSGQNSLSAISTSGGGVYSSANTTSELDQQLKAKWDNISNLREESICKRNSETVVFTCLNDSINKTRDTIYGITETLNSGLITEAEFSYLIKLSEDIGTKYQEIMNNMSATTDAYLEGKDNLLDSQL